MIFTPGRVGVQAVGLAQARRPTPASRSRIERHVLGLGDRRKHRVEVAGVAGADGAGRGHGRPARRRSAAPSAAVRWPTRLALVVLRVDALQTDRCRQAPPGRRRCRPGPRSPAGPGRRRWCRRKRRRRARPPSARSGQRRRELGRQGVGGGQPRPAVIEIAEDGHHRRLAPRRRRGTAPARSRPATMPAADEQYDQVCRASTSLM